MAVCRKPGKRYGCFPPFPQTLEIAGRLIPESQPYRAISTFPPPAATTATMSKFKTRKEPSYFANPSPPSGSSFDWKRLGARKDGHSPPTADLPLRDRVQGAHRLHRR